MERCPKCGWHHTDECMGGSMVADHNPTIRSTRTPILVSAMRLLAQEIQSEDGVANAAIAEAGNRLSELEAQLAQAQQGVGEGITRPHDGPERCPTYYDGCNCTVEVLVHNIERAKRAERRVAELERRLADEERGHGQTIDERDRCHDWADKLARAIAEHMREDIGEHSSANNPWANALELIDGTFCR